MISNSDNLIQEALDDWTDVDVSLLRPGLILASDIYSDNHLLLAKKTAITAGFIRALEKRSIFRIRINTETAEKLKRAECEDVAQQIRQLDHIPHGLLLAISNELVKNEVSLWLDAGIESAVEDKLRISTQKVIEGLFDGLAHGVNVKLDSTKTYLQDIIRQIQLRPSAAVKLSDVRNSDEYTFFHSVNACLIFIKISKALFGDEELKSLSLGALFHDVGKVYIQRSILQKKEKLSGKELSIIRNHCALGAKTLLDKTDFCERAVEMVLNHHERWDSTGYPRQLNAQHLSRETQILSVCDVYDALTTTRCYAGKYDYASAMNYVIKSSGSMFSPFAVNRLWSELGTYPVGSFVRLSTGQIAVVRNLNANDVTRPIVVVVYNSNFQRLNSPRLINLEQDVDVIITKVFTPRHNV